MWSPRNLLVLGSLLLLAALLHLQHHRGLVQGRAEVRAEWSAATQAAQATTREIENEAQRQAARAASAAAQRQLAADTAAAGARVELGSLRAQLDGLRHKQSASADTATAAAAPQPASPAGATTPGDVLGACASAAVGLAEDAERLAEQARQLQDWFRMAEQAGLVQR